jgi:hypothetical protein
MKNIKILKGILYFSFFLIVGGLIPIFPWSFGLCESVNDFDCVDKFESYRVLLLLTDIGLITLLVSALKILKLRSEEAFLSWKKFAKYYTPFIVLIGIGAFFEDGGGSWGVSVGSTGDLFIFSLVLFYVISLILIIYKSIKLRGK